jgi:hypothetical protein
MKKEKNTESLTKLTDNTFINLDLSADVKNNANVLLIGSNLNGIFGYFKFDLNNGIRTNTVSLDLSRTNVQTFANLQFLINIFRNKGTIYVVANEQILKEYFDMLFNYLQVLKICSKKQVKYISGIYNDKDYWDYDYTDENGQKHTHPGKMNKLKGMQFDYIVQNPPYSGSLHLTFFEKSLELLKDDGKMVIIEPATWLINVRRNGKAKIYDNIKKLVKGHVKSVRIENLNNEFSTSQYTPFSITKIDNSKEYSEIEYSCFGVNTTVDNLYDCNLIGSYDLIWSILEKVQQYGDMMKNHEYKEKTAIDNNTWYTKYANIIGCSGCNISAANNGYSYESDALYSDCLNNFNFLISYTSGYITKFNNIFSSIPKSVKRGSTKGELSDKNAYCLYGTKSELENWKHFVFNNKLPLFINMVMTIDQHNNSLPYIPWLVDKIYTDDEINELFNFTEDEINLIDKTIKKFERHSLWFKRYMCGPSSVTDEDVQKDLNNI